MPKDHFIMKVLHQIFLSHFFIFCKREKQSLFTIDLNSYVHKKKKKMKKKKEKKRRKRRKEKPVKKKKKKRGTHTHTHTQTTFVYASFIHSLFFSSLPCSAPLVASACLIQHVLWPLFNLGDGLWHSIYNLSIESINRFIRVKTDGWMDGLIGGCKSKQQHNNWMVCVPSL